MSYNPNLTFSIRAADGHLIGTSDAGVVTDFGQVVGASGNLFNIVTKTSNYTVLAADVANNPLFLLLDASAGNVVLTLDASLLFTAAAGGNPATSKTVVIKRIDTTTANSVTITPTNGQTIDGGTAALEISKASRTILASAANALQII